MIYSLAPMDGLTGHSFRQVHAKVFGALDRYYTPFLTPPQPGTNFGKRALLELDTEADRGLTVVPQLLTNDADACIWAAQLLADKGFKELNLNLGCPSQTVVSKGRGAGFLQHLGELEVFIGRVCAESPLPISVKTRLGMHDDAEFEQVLAVYCKFPLAELTVHPRVQRDFYKGRPRWEAFGQALAQAPFPVAYNGDIFSCADAQALAAAYPSVQHLMLGRGVLANPALVRELRGGAPASREELEQFHSELLAAYKLEMGPKALFRMKEWWFYAKCAFANPLEVHRRVRRTRGLEEYRAAVAQVFQEEELAAQPAFAPLDSRALAA